MFPLWPTAFLIVLALSFYYFILAGARTFEISPSDDLASGVAQFSFLVTGTIGTMFLGYRAAVPLGNAIGSAALLAGSLALYEWARHTIRERRFHIAWSGDVPEELCEAGPYAHVRHPLYASYILAFAAMLVALPKLATLAIFLLNVGLFVHAARHDERSIAESDLSEEYARYKRRAGMFLPRLFRR
jgi:protein-S-isoprenylcysteine O-methyltransferase Ste14